MSPKSPDERDKSAKHNNFFVSGIRPRSDSKKMVKIEKITHEEAEEEFAKSATKGQWKELLENIEEDGEPRKITGLTRGQVAALYRSAKNAGLDVKTSYKNGYVVVSPSE